MVYYGRSSEGNKIYGLFGHFSVRGKIVATGDIVNRNQMIGEGQHIAEMGYKGTTSRSGFRGSHLDLEVYILDPRVHGYNRIGETINPRQFYRDYPEGFLFNPLPNNLGLDQMSLINPGDYYNDSSQSTINYGNGNINIGIGGDSIGVSIGWNW